MRTTKRQADIINKIMTEEIELALADREDAKKLRRVSKLNELMLESPPDPVRVDKQIMNSTLDSEIQIAIDEAVDSFMANFDTKLYSVIAKIMNTHAMSHEKVSGEDLRLDVYDHNDGVRDDEMDCISQLTAALENYSHEIAKSCVAIAGGASTEEESI